MTDKASTLAPERSTIRRVTLLVLVLTATLALAAPSASASTPLDCKGGAIGGMGTDKEGYFVVWGCARVSWDRTGDSTHVTLDAFGETVKT